MNASCDCISKCLKILFQKTSETQPLIRENKSDSSLYEKNSKGNHLRSKSDSELQEAAQKNRKIIEVFNVVGLNMLKILKKYVKNLTIESREQFNDAIKNFEQTMNNRNSLMGLLHELDKDCRGNERKPFMAIDQNPIPERDILDEFFKRRSSINGSLILNNADLSANINTIYIILNKGKKSFDAINFKDDFKQINNFIESIKKNDQSGPLDYDTDHTARLLESIDKFSEIVKLICKEKCDEYEKYEAFWKLRPLNCIPTKH